MPFVKREGSVSAGAPTSSDVATHAPALQSTDPHLRWDAARALGGRAEAVPALAAALAAERVPHVRDV